MTKTKICKDEIKSESSTSSTTSSTSRNTSTCTSTSLSTRKSLKHFCNKYLICFYNFLTNLHFLVYWLTDWLIPVIFRGPSPLKMFCFFIYYKHQISWTDNFLSKLWMFVKWWIFVTNINLMHEYSPQWWIFNKIMKFFWNLESYKKNGEF